MFTNPPRSPSPAQSIQLNRRNLLGASLLGAAASATPLAAQVQSKRGFTHGVASGEPSANSVLLWTRYVSSGSAGVEWVISESADLSNPVAGGTAPLAPQKDYCIKVTTSDDLKPGTWYYYQFTAPDGMKSPIGRTRTLPQGPTARWKMAVFSCSNIGFGWFNAYAHAAETNEFDCTLHLGDYFYEYPPGTYPSSYQAVAERTFAPDAETVTLADYRMRYASYRADKDLQRIHQLYPMISGWDDHESTNDSWKGGAQNHQPETEGDWATRKRIAAQVYREWMPVSDKDWATYQIGDLATLFRLETRLLARDEQFSIEAVAKGATSTEQAVQQLRDFSREEYLDPARHLLGERQEQWLADGLKQSRGGGTTWQVLVQQVLMGKLATPVQLAAALPEDAPDFVRSRVEAGALASSAGLPLNMDAWDGYPAARDRVLKSALEANANLISLAGDTHNGWAFNLDLDGTPVGVEMGGHSVTSPGLESYLGAIPQDTMERLLRERNPQLAWADTATRGYMAVELTPDKATSEWRSLATVKQRSTQLAKSHRMSAAAGDNRYS